MIALALRHARSRWGRSLMLCACVLVIAGLPLVSRSVVSRFEHDLRARAETVPLLVGSAGSRFDLVLAGLHWRTSEIRPVPLALSEEVRREPATLAIPVHVRFTARGVPVAAVPYEYFEQRALSVRDGRLVAGIGEAVLGSAAASRLGLGVGDELASDQLRSYDITAPPSLTLRVVGVLRRTATPDDACVFVDLETAWLLEGISHGHEEASSITDPDLLIGRSDERVALSGAVIEHQRVDENNIASFHLHEERDRLPVTAVLVFPGSAKSAALIRTRINADPALQALSPTAVSEELIGSVLRVRRMVDAISLVVGVAMLGLLALVGSLSWRARADEIRTLRDVGATRSQIALLFAAEFAGIVIVALAGAGVLAWGTAGLADRILALFT